MENITTRNQLYFDFGRDYDASLENFFFSNKNQVLKNELKELIHSEQKKRYIYFRNIWFWKDIFIKFSFKS